MVLTETAKDTISNYCGSKVAIQGIEGSFHHIATMEYYETAVNLVPCDRFEDIFKHLRQGTADRAVIAIENSVAGTILPNYSLLRTAHFPIIGEVYLRIKHQLLSLAGTSIADVERVYSHPMALLQCQDFFKAYPHIRLIESDDTAASAKRLAESGEVGVAVIASALAGEIFGLTAIAADIEDNKRNFTRFLILDKAAEAIPKAAVNKASISFHLPHEVGSLANVLTVLAEAGVNLTKIQSLPLVGHEWQYRFHLDMEFEYYDLYESALRRIQPFVEELQVLGAYQKGKTFY